ncbi:hypothetical protein LTR70_010121 [Exophiala xenobiotica]|uniref:Uncharacterized protein n=1 Tax=Lithohypha guttulata TaxID=1690604 RepID=A0ABR0JVQ4_9EURO|nr:hypothetical protein LTR24_010078 [Lithohypha guttulata]KAK5309623.1 hypothetical protein LTR70_010121 [Exophiala xenobiotica]
MASKLRTRQNLQYLDDYLDQPIPELSFEEKERATKSTAWHPDKSLAIEVVKWDDFDETIDEWRNQILGKLQEDASLLVEQDVTCVCPSSEGKDSVLCGNDLSVQGRFIQHATKPVQDLQCLYGIECQISDFNILKTRAPKSAPAVVPTATQASRMPGSGTVAQASSPARSLRLSFSPNRDSEAKAKDRAQSEDEDEMARLVPDIIVCKNEGVLALLVGELKTPWKHDLKELAVLFGDENRQISIQKKARLWVARIVEFMQNHELQYGFLTTYEATVFLQLQQRGSN